MFVAAICAFVDFVKLAAGLDEVAESAGDVAVASDAARGATEVEALVITLAVDVVRAFICPLDRILASK